jgi:hypothetical protein
MKVKYEGGAEKLEELKQAYRKALAAGNFSSLARVEMEDEMWERHKALTSGTLREGYKQQRRDWFVSIFGHATSGYENRATIYNAGPWAYRLFDMLDKGLIKLSTASRMIAEVKAVAVKKNVTNEEALAGLFSSYNGTPRSLGLVRGRPVSLREPILSAEASAEVDVDAVSFDTYDSNLSVSRTYKRNVLALTSKYLTHVVPDKNTRDLIRQGFELSLGQLIEEMRNNVNKVRISDRRAEREEVVSVDQFTWACEVLGLPFAYGDVFDIVRVNRAKMRRARDLHPDRNPTPEAKTEYQAVLEAFETMQKYSKKRESK